MTDAPQFPFPDLPGVGLDSGYACRYREQPLIPVRIRGDHPALLVTGHADVRTVLSDDRFSREAWGGGTMFARDSASLALVTSDPPTHTARRRAVQAAFTHRQAELARPRIQQLADELLDAVAAADQPVDLVEAYLRPLPYRVICELVGVPAADIDLLQPWVDVMMSAGAYDPAEVAAARERMFGYFADQVRDRRRRADAGTPAADLLGTLVAAPEPLSETELVVMAFGLVMAGGETAANHLAMCTHHVLADPALQARLRAHPEQIPAAVEELLRWVWFAGTGGQPHVALADVALAGTVIAAGQVVVPLTDAANRCPAAFDEPDEFRPDRSPNPHLGFGYGRHLCLGAPHARVELQVALATLLRRFPHLHLDTTEVTWRDRMFLRSMDRLPVTWPRE
ncbi:cytochrome P450 [Catellatospora sp. TT07R-123]|uniref:cytochrome P450 n=1 Tax=Catellatospora sp. TT07R-123 TaxID=2733863 RepID=UPI001B152EFE|nr:cytochrome P450 [Catellatospora sp. TT07R-123]GHJ42822.1 cytochrome P450 [Catellatospora sp. TT07R-123]